MVYLKLGEGGKPLKSNLYSFPKVTGTKVVGDVMYEVKEYFAMLEKTNGNIHLG